MTEGVSKEYQSLKQPDKRAQAVLQAFDQHRTSRSNYETIWREIAEYILPRYADSFDRRASMPHGKGQKNTEKMLDLTGAKGLERFAAAMDGMLTPRTQQWHRLRASNPDLMRSLNVRRYFEQTTEILFRYRYSAKANFSAQNHENFIGLGAFGNAGMFIEPPQIAGEVGLRYRAEHLGGIYVAANPFGIVDTMFRQVWLTARQAAVKFGMENLGPVLIKELNKPEKSRDPTKEFEFVHCVRPKNENDPYAVGEDDMRWKSIYVSRDDEIIVKSGGYFSFPLAFSRYTTGPHELYGRSPALLALGAIKSLQEQKKTALKAGHRAVDPVYIAHDDGIIDAFSAKPGFINYGGVNAQGQKMVQTLDSGVSWRPAEVMMEQDRRDVDDLFLVSLFQLLQENPQQTATEVIEKARERGMLLAPTMGRQQSEYLAVMIERELDVLARQGLLPEMPPELIEAEGEYEVEHDSPVSRAMRAEEAGGLMRYLEFAGTYAEMTQDISMFDKIDPDTASDDLAWILNVPAKYMADEEAVQEKRNQRAEAAQMQQMVDAAPAAASIAKTVQGGGQ